MVLRKKQDQIQDSGVLQLTYNPNNDDPNRRRAQMAVGGVDDENIDYDLTRPRIVVRKKKAPEYVGTDSGQPEKEYVDVPGEEPKEDNVQMVRLRKWQEKARSGRSRRK